MAEATQEIQGELGCDLVSLELREWAIRERDAGKGEVFEDTIQMKKNDTIRICDKCGGYKFSLVGSIPKPKDADRFNFILQCDSCKAKYEVFMKKKQTKGGEAA